MNIKTARVIVSSLFYFHNTQKNNRIEIKRLRGLFQ
jgi:hypothetical protein